MASSQHTIQTTQERQFMSGMLSVTTTFRLMTTGNTDVKHLERLIRILRLQKEILEEDEIEDLLPELAWYCPPALMTGIFNSLPPDRQKEAMAYRGPENMGQQTPGA